ncbi:MAG: glycosyltransferase family A protein [Streptosporangiaceae bacterium]
MISTVLLSWNRPHMLHRTLRSYRETTRSPAELIVVDNGSGRETRTLIESAESAGVIDTAIFLPANEGGLALNYPTPFLRGSYVHYSENDVEYRPHWDAAMLAKFEAFPSLGQLSPFAPKPEVDIGEVWVEHRGQLATSSGQNVFVTNAGVGTTSIIRRQVLEHGARWTNIEAGEWRWPNDASFSSQVRKNGFAVAWNDKYVAANLGHNISEFEQNLPYYLAGYAAKRWVGVGGLERRLLSAGYELVRGGDGNVADIRKRH